MLLPKSGYVYIPYIKSVAPRVCLAKVPFLASFGPDIQKSGCDHKNVLKTFLRLY